MLIIIFFLLKHIKYLTIKINVLRIGMIGVVWCYSISLSRLFISSKINFNFPMVSV